MNTVLRPPAPPREDITEAAFQDLVVHLAKVCGWTCYHTFDSRRSEAGYPDLTLVRERVIWRELKARRGRMTAEQQEWGRLLQAANANWGLWYPSDWPLICDILTAPIQRHL